MSVGIKVTATNKPNPFMQRTTTSLSILSEVEQFLNLTLSTEDTKTGLVEKLKILIQVKIMMITPKVAKKGFEDKYIDELASSAVVKINNCIDLKEQKNSITTS